MKPMTSRDRFLASMERRPVDRVPFDIGGTSLTGMRPLCRQRLRQVLGFPEPPRGSGDERLLEWAGTDFRNVGGIVRLPSRVAGRLSDRAEIDCWGVRRERIDGEWQIVNPPLRGATAADLDAYPWPEPRIDEAWLAACRQRAQELRREARYAVVGEHPVFGILELGCWMCGYDDFLLRLAADPEFVKRFFDRVLAVQLAVIETYYAALGPYLDLTTSGDDFGSQNGPLLSPAMFEELVAPFFAPRIARTKALARCPYWHHTCGSVYRLLPQLIACGIDILNPVQTSAAEMNPSALKQRFGDRLAFWGGMDVQQFLPRATPREVVGRARELAAVLGAGGGYVMAPAHEMQDDIPPENIVAWVEAVKAMPGAGRQPAG